MHNISRLPAQRILKRIDRTFKRVRNKVWNVWDAYQLKQMTDAYSFGAGYKRIYHYHIKKTGGTSLNTIFLITASSFTSLDARIEDAAVIYKTIAHTKRHRVIRDDKILVGWDKSLIESGRYFYAHSHIPQHNLRLPAHTFTVTCLRDPMKRVLSRYNQLMYYKEYAVPHPGMKRAGPWLGETFGDFLDRVPKDELLCQLSMFSKTYDIEESFEHICRCSYFFLTEDFASAIGELSTRLNLPLEPIHIRKADKSYPVTAAERERLRDMLAPEYTLYEKASAAYHRNKANAQSPH